MYCLWEQFGLVDDKRELSLNGMLTFFQRIPAYRAEVQRAIRECKGIGKYLGIYLFFFILFPYECIRNFNFIILYLNHFFFLLINIYIFIHFLFNFLQ